jgi:capsular polysaccharide biosynthesis protein
VQVAELSEMSFYPDQLSLMLRARVLAGVHGAGLANQIYMRPRAGSVVELWYGMDSNTHYHNMAHMLGHTYFNVKCEEERLDVRAVAAKVTAAMDAAAAKHAAALSATAQARRAWWWRRKHPDAKPV